jgi:FemAB-related protein (PEP-CTERM system-associated)
MVTHGLDARLVVSADIDERDWNRFVEKHPDASMYHLWGWRRVFEDAFRHDTKYLAAIENGDIVGVLPLVIFHSWAFGRFAVSLPFVNYGGVLARNERVKRALIDAASELARDRGLSHIELRHRARLFVDLPAKRHKVAMKLPLPDTTELAWEALDRKVRNQIRKAQKSGLTAEIGGAELLDVFYAIFAQNMRDLGTPVYPAAFFAKTLEHFPNRVRIIVVNKGHQRVAAGIISTFREVIEVPSASSLRDFWSCCPNHLLYWTVIQHAIAHGLTVLDFGRSTPGEGTFLFKQQWGAQSEPLCWEYRLLSRTSLPNRSLANHKFAPAIALWKRLPVSFATLIGPQIARGLP